MRAESDVEDFFEDMFGIKDNYSVMVDLRTDFLPGEDFTQVRVTVDGGNLRTSPIDRGMNAIQGIRVAEYNLQENRDYLVRAELIGPDGAVLEGGTRQTRLSLREQPLGMILLISRPYVPPPEEPAEVAPALVNANDPSLQRQLRQGSVSPMLQQAFREGVLVRALTDTGTAAPESPPVVEPVGSSATPDSGRGIESGDDLSVVTSPIAIDSPAKTGSDANAGQGFDDPKIANGGGGAFSGGGLSCSLDRATASMNGDVTFLILALILKSVLKKSPSTSHRGAKSKIVEMNF